MTFVEILPGLRIRASAVIGVECRDLGSGQWGVLVILPQRDYPVEFLNDEERARAAADGILSRISNS